MSAIMLLALLAGSWGPRGCVAVAMPQAQRTTHEWVAVPSRSDEFALMRDGRQIGSYSQNRGLYRPYDRRTDSWGEPCDPPIAAPVRKVDDPPMIEQHPESTNFGIDLSKLSTGREVVTISGREVTLADGLRAVGKPGGTIPDDSKKPWIVYVGDPATCRKVEADMAGDPALSAYKDKFRLQCYPPDDPMTKDRDGKVMYDPGVWIVGADRKVMGRMPTYSTAAVFAEGLRRLGPDWDPAKVPDLSKPADPLPSLPNLTKVPAWQVGAGLAGAGLLFFVARWLLRLAPVVLPLLTKSSQQPTPPVAPAPAPAPAPVARRPSKEALEAARQLMEGRK